jgi:hypothetical protein
MKRVGLLSAMVLALAISASAQVPSGTQHSAVGTFNAPSPVGGSGVVQGYIASRAALPTGPYTALNTTPFTGTTFTDSTVLVGQSYSYCVQTVDSNGNVSVCSNVVTVTVPTNPNAPSSLTIVVHSGEYKKKPPKRNLLQRMFAVRQ